MSQSNAAIILPRRLAIRRKLRSWRFVISLATIGLTLLCLEAATHLLIPEDEWITRPHPTTDDNLLGYKLKPNLTVEAVKKKNGEVVYDVTYSTDEYGRRITPVEKRQNRIRSILFFGCSYTFGEGVQDNETLPFYVSQVASQYRVYNYGVEGYGPQHMLAKLQKRELPGEISGRDGATLVFTFIDHHIARVMGWMQTLPWGSHFPYYVMDGADRLVYKGNFISGRPLLSKLYVLMWKSRLVQYLDTRLHLPKVNEENIRLTAKIIEESRNVFRETFHSENFYILFHPNGSGEYAKRLIPYLKRAGIKYLDYSDIADEAIRDKIPNDSHPSSKSYRAVALKLAQDIGIAPDAAETLTDRN